MCFQVPSPSLGSLLHTSRTQATSHSSTLTTLTPCYIIAYPPVQAPTLSHTPPSTPLHPAHPIPIPAYITAPKPMPIHVYYRPPQQGQSSRAHPWSTRLGPWSFSHPALCRRLMCVGACRRQLMGIHLSTIWSLNSLKYPFLLDIMQAWDKGHEACLLPCCDIS